MEIKVGLAYVRALNFDQSFQQFNAKKKINAKKFLYLKLAKCWILKTSSLNIDVEFTLWGTPTFNLSKIKGKIWSEHWTYQFPNTDE